MANFTTDLEQLKKHASRIRQSMIKTVVKAKGAHLGGGLSSVEILTALYFSVMNIDPVNPKKADRDRLIFSKGHCANALYVTLVERGFAPDSILDDYYADGKLLTGHPTRDCMPGVEVSTGALGHGLSMGAGMAWAAKHDRKPYRVFVVLSDGECDEGSTWEAALSAGHYKLDNLIAVIDYNKIQSLGRTSEVLDLEPFREKWEAFGWTVKEIDGHNFEEFLKTFRDLPFAPARPSVVIAHTVKGKGVPALENTLVSHYTAPSPDMLKGIIEGY